MRVLAGFCLVYLAIWFVQLILGVGPYLILRRIGASENVRVFVGSTVTRLGVLAVVMLLSDLGLRRILGSRLKAVAYSAHPGWWQDLFFSCLLTLLPMLVFFGIQIAQNWLIVETWL